MKKFWVLPLLFSLSGICQASPWIYPDGKYKVDLPQGWPDAPKSSQRWSAGKDMFCELSTSKQSRQDTANSVLSIQQSFLSKKQGKVQVIVGKLGNLDTWLLELEPTDNGHITIYYLSDGTVTRSVYLKTASADSDRLKRERAAIIKSFSAVAPLQAKSTSQPKSQPESAPSNPFQQCQAEFYKAFDEAADASERAQATEAYSYKLEKIRPHSDSQNAEVFLKAVAPRVNAHASEAGNLLMHCKCINSETMRRAREQNLLVPEVLQSIKTYADRLVKEFNQERDAEYRHQAPPPKTTRSQADQLQQGWAYRQGRNQYLILQRTAYQQYRVAVQEFRPHLDPKKPQMTPSYSVKEVSISGEELMCGQRIKNSAVVCSRCRGAGSLDGFQQDKGGPYASQGRSVPVAVLSDKQFADCKPCGGSGLIVNSKPTDAPAVAASPKRSAEEIYNVGHQAKVRGDYAEAIRHYQEALRCPGLNAGDRSGIHSDMGVAYACWGKQSMAFSEYNLALAEDPKNPVALYNRANSWIDGGVYLGALRDLEAAQLYARTPQQSLLIKQQLAQVRELMASAGASNKPPSGTQHNNGSSQGMGGWKDASELQRRTTETLERQRRENAERASQHPNRKY